MGNDLQRVGLVFKADGAVDFKKTIQQVNDAVQENRNSFQLAKTAWDDSTSAMDKLKDRQEYLTKQTEIYSDKVNILQEELKSLENAEERNEQAIRKKKNQLTNAKTTLINYQKGLADVTKQIESGSAVTDEEMKRLDGTMDTLSASAKENETAFELLKSQWEDSTKTAEKLCDEQKFLTSQTQNYEEQVRILGKQLDILENAEDKNEKAIQDKKSELNQAKTALNNYKNGLEEVEQKLKSGAAKTKDYTDKLDGLADKAKNAGDKLSGVSTAAAGVAAAAVATVPATEEYRKIMASLESSSELAGYTAEETEETYRQLFGVLGDDQTAATTTANLQALGLSQERLTELTKGTIGAWAKYGDSIPIDGLAEAINETAKVGTVTGTFADVLNWAGTSEDEFNEKLAACGSESERVDLIMQELAGQGLTQAGEKWQENNKNLVEGRNATADFQEATAELAETIAPIITEITELAAGMLNKFNELPTSTQKIIAGIVLLVAALSPALNVIGSVSGGVSNFISIAGKVPGILSTIGTGAKVLWAIMAANPIAAVIAIVGVLIGVFVTLYNKCEWFRDGVNEIWGGLKSFLSGMRDWLIRLFDFEWKLPEIKVPHFTITPSGWKVGDLMKGSIPKLGIEWYANGGILNSPTIFGSNGNGLLGGGEAGAEAVLPIEVLKSYIREENMQNNAVLAQLIMDAMKELKITAENNFYLGNRKIYSEIAELVIKKISSERKEKNIAKGILA